MKNNFSIYTLNRLRLVMNASIFPNHACTATRILEKRRQLLEIQDALEEQKDDFARKVDAFQRREDALRKKDLRLQDSLIKFNKFLQDNESKRTRAIRRFVITPFCHSQIGTTMLT